MKNDSILPCTAREEIRIFICAFFFYFFKKTFFLSLKLLYFISKQDFKKSFFFRIKKNKKKPNFFENLRQHPLKKQTFLFNEIMKIRERCFSSSLKEIPRYKSSFFTLMKKALSQTNQVFFGFSSFSSQSR
eukprot:GDKJ01019553.1.p1 GENE.GDKJ01019553.1~~GDKJ01019553.1.p1  ORF type:complete len:131 (-),score=35.17 GDKJ01019553.1:739-1131(-)